LFIYSTSTVACRKNFTDTLETVFLCVVLVLSAALWRNKVHEIMWTKRT